MQLILKVISLSLEVNKDQKKTTTTTKQEKRSLSYCVSEKLTEDVGKLVTALPLTVTETPPVTVKQTSPYRKRHQNNDCTRFLTSLQKKRSRYLVSH